MAPASPRPGRTSIMAMNAGQRTGVVVVGAGTIGLGVAVRASELERASGLPVPLAGAETLFVARDPDEAAELERQLEFRHSLGLEVTRLRASEAREREPALAPTIRMALVLGGERTVDPR